MSICRFPNCFMVYQPIVDLRSGRVILYEALFRSGGGEISQGVCHDAEREGWIIEVDLYALSTAQKLMRDNPCIALTINISGASIAFFSDRILQQLDRERPACNRLFFEITESQHVELDALKAFADSCRERQVKIAQDDFGIEFSTLERARVLQPCLLKVVAPIQLDKLDRWGQSNLRDAAEVAQELGAVLVVERIETQHAERVAVRHGASAGQGYAYGKPASLPSLAWNPPASPLVARSRPATAAHPFLGASKL